MQVFDLRSKPCLISHQLFPFFLFMDSIKCHLCLPLWFSQGINLHSQVKTNAASYHTGKATAIAISAASRSARETWSDVYLAWGSRGHIKESSDLIIISRIQLFFNFLTMNNVDKASRHQEQTNRHHRYREQKLHRISCWAESLGEIHQYTLHICQINFS